MTIQYNYKIAASIVTYNSPMRDVVLAAKTYLACNMPVHLTIVDNNSSEGYLKVCRNNSAHDSYEVT